MSKIKNIIFDMGNVLLEFNPYISLDYFCKSQEEKDKILQELFHGPEWIMGDEGKITNGQRFELVAKRVPKEMHRTLKLVVENWDMCMKEVPGAADFVKKVRREGYSCYVLSNACNRFYHFFPKHFDMEVFKGVVVSSDVKMIKPHHDIYQYTCQVHSLVFEECLFVDDREENVRAAIECGMKGVVFNGDFRKVEEALL